MIFRKLPARLITQTYKASYVTKAPKPEIPKNPLSEVYSATGQKSNGIVYDKKPFKVTLQEGKTYHWCLCGRSKAQPLCDGTHKDVYLKIAQSWYDGFSTFYVGGDGLIQKHVADKTNPTKRGRTQPRVDPLPKSKKKKEKRKEEKQ